MAIYKMFKEINYPITKTRKQEEPIRNEEAYGVGKGRKFQKLTF